MFVLMGKFFIFLLHSSYTDESLISLCSLITLFTYHCASDVLLSRVVVTLYIIIVCIEICSLIFLVLGVYIRNSISFP